MKKIQLVTLDAEAVYVPWRRFVPCCDRCGSAGCPVNLVGWFLSYSAQGFPRRRRNPRFGLGFGDDESKLLAKLQRKRTRGRQLHNDRGRRMRLRSLRTVRTSVKGGSRYVRTSRRRRRFLALVARLLRLPHPAADRITHPCQVESTLLFDRRNRNGLPRFTSLTFVERRKVTAAHAVRDGVIGCLPLKTFRDFFNSIDVRNGTIF